MTPLPYRRLAPVLADWACLMLFVFLGGSSTTSTAPGVTWYLTVLVAAGGRVPRRRLITQALHRRRPLVVRLVGDRRDRRGPRRSAARHLHRPRLHCPSTASCCSCFNLVTFGVAPGLARGGALEAYRSLRMTDRVPHLNARLARLRHDDLRRDVRARGRAPGRSTSARASPTPTARPEIARGGDRRRSAPATTSTRPGPASPSCATRSPTHQRHWYGLDVRPGHRGARHRRRDRGDRRDAARAVRRRRRGRDVRAVLRLVRRVHRDGRRRAAAGHAPAARLRLRPRRAARRRSRPAPGCCCSTRRTTRPARCSPAPSSSSIAEVCVEHDLIAVTDEVYEHLIFDGVEHVPLATLPGMRERTVTISSAGKTFSFTGWKIGWVCASPELPRRGAHREAVPHLRERRAVPARDRRRARRCPTRTFTAFAADLGRRRDQLVRRPARRRASRSTRRPARTS